MTPTGKVFAPKPIRRISKVNLDFPDNCSLNYNSFSAKNKKILNWDEMKNEVDDFKDDAICFQPYFQFESDLNKEIDIDIAKSEIFSILGRSDTSATELKSSVATCDDHMNEDEYTSVRNSVPIRTSNPIHKNFQEMSDDEWDLELFKFKSTNLIKPKSSLALNQQDYRKDEEF